MRLRGSKGATIRLDFWSLDRPSDPSGRPRDSKNGRAAGTATLSRLMYALATARTVPVSIIDGGAFADSRDVAAFFGRAHKNVLAGLRNTEEACSPEFARLNLQPVHVQGHSRTVLSHYLMTKDGFAFAVLRFTGAKAARFKEAYIGEFNRVAEELARPKTSVPPVDPLALLDDPDILRGLLGRYAERVAVERQERLIAEATVEAARPAIEFVGALADSDGLWGLRAAGKALHQGPDLFIRWLRGRGALYDLNDGPVAKLDPINAGSSRCPGRSMAESPGRRQRSRGRGMVHYAKALGARPPGAPAQALLPGL